MESGHVFVALNNSFEISADSWCLTGTAWWDDAAGAAAAAGGARNLASDAAQRRRLCESIEMNGPRAWEVLCKAGLFKGAVQQVSVPALPEAGFSRAAVVGRGTRLDFSPPVGVFTSVRVPKEVRDEGGKIPWLLTSLEEYLVVAARWLARPRDAIAAAIWEAAQRPEDSQVWERLCPGGVSITAATLCERLWAGASACGSSCGSGAPPCVAAASAAAARAAADAAAAEVPGAGDDEDETAGGCPLRWARALETLRSLRFGDVDGATYLELHPEGISLEALQAAVFRGEAKRARRRNYLLTAPVVGTGAGGAEGEAGRVVEAILGRLLKVVRGEHPLWPRTLSGQPIVADVVLICPDKNVFSQAQSWRRDHFDAFFPPPLFGGREHVRTRAEDIGRFASAGRLAIFIGAGVSAGAGLPSWFGVLGLVEQDVERLLLAHTGERLQLDMGRRTAAPDGSWNPLKFASGLEAKLEKIPHDLYRAHFPLKACSQSSHALEDAHAAELSATVMFKELVLRHLETPYHSLLHALLAAMPVEKMVTQNYDNLLEQASNSVDMFNKARPYRHDALSVLPLAPIAESRRWVLKMHGTSDVPASIVITEQDYAEYDDRAGALSGLVQGTMLTCHMFFIGFSGTDANYKKILRAVKKSKPKRDHEGMATLLTIVDDGVEHDDAVDVLLFSEEGSIPDGARMQEIWMDMCLLHADAFSPKAILDPRVDSALTSDERRLKSQLQQLAETLAKEPKSLLDSASYRAVVQLLEQLGFHFEPPGTRSGFNTNFCEKMRRAMDVLNIAGLELLLETAKATQINGLDPGDLPAIAEQAERLQESHSRFPRASSASEQLGNGATQAPKLARTESEAKASSVSAAFRSADLNRDGMISSKELGALLYALNPSWPEECTDSLLANVKVKDRIVEDTLSFDDFVEWLYSEQACEALHIPAP
eukprot:TRINITY_DN8228_c1_g1_i1.p1 TRINITY_DN8228_c1_g1~~TRINITY_DN8228_c1_g1_i1.p1  ORF type:complete len:939 (+),score=203.62 TRINITY_DN8228_c1_g1_i1:101-2917(+)